MTPVLSFSEVAITTNVKRLHEVAVQSEHRWAAVLSRLVPIRLLRDLILPITKLHPAAKFTMPSTWQMRVSKRSFLLVELSI